MKRTIISISLLCVLAALLVVLYLTRAKPTPTTSSPTTKTGAISQLVDRSTGEIKDEPTIDITREDLAQEYPGGGTYESFTATAAKQALGDKKTVILYFSASRDPTDQALDNDIVERKARIPANTVIFKLDYDKEASLKKAFNIVRHNTLVFLDEQGTEKTRRALGITSLSQIVDILNGIK